VFLCKGEWLAKERNEVENTEGKNERQRESEDVKAEKNQNNEYGSAEIMKQLF
jgi:hypothetical protein